MAKIYTKTGDTGECGLIGGRRVSKSCARIQAIGDLDEANAAIGVVVASRLDRDIVQALIRVQAELFELGASLAAGEDRSGKGPGITEEHVRRLEEDIDRYSAGLEPLARFILPGGCPESAVMQFARSVVRRAERAVVALNEQEPVDPVVLQYLNRLSDLLFVLARTANRRSGVEEMKWSAEVNA